MILFLKVMWSISAVSHLALTLMFVYGIRKNILTKERRLQYVLITIAYILMTYVFFKDVF